MTHLRCVHCRLSFLRVDDYQLHSCCDLPPQVHVEPPTVLLERLRASIGRHPSQKGPSWDK